MEHKSLTQFSCQEKYQKPQMIHFNRWYHFKGRKWRGIKEPIDEGERRVKMLVYNSIFTKLRSWHPVPTLHGKQMGRKWKQWQILFSWAPKSLQTINAVMKLRHLVLGRKALTNLDSILKSRDITLPTKVHPVKAMVFPVVMYRFERWQ